MDYDEWRAISLPENSYKLDAPSTLILNQHSALSTFFQVRAIIYS